MTLTPKANARAPSVWHPNREFFGINREIMRAFAPVLLERFSPGLRNFILAGSDSAALQTMKDLLALNVSREILFNTLLNDHRAIYQKILVGFDLPAESIFGAHGERRQINGVQLHFVLSSEYQRWELQTSVSLATTAHELLELQLRLRDALRPILTDTEIAEILGA